MQRCSLLRMLPTTLHILYTTQSLSGMPDQWKLEMEAASTAVASSTGALCLSISTATYLASLKPHEQMEAINSDLVPLFEEGGIKLCWNNDNVIVNALKQVVQVEHIIKSPLPEDGEKIPKVDSHTGEPALSTVESPSRKQKRYADIDCSKRALSSSYASCSSNIQSLLVKEQFLDKWLTCSCSSASLAYLMPCSLIHTAWNRWSLVCDPEGFASKWIKEYSGGGLICLDGRDRYI